MSIAVSSVLIRPVYNMKTVEDINLALTLNGLEQEYGLNSNGAEGFLSPDTAAAAASDVIDLGTLSHDAQRLKTEPSTVYLNAMNTCVYVRTCRVGLYHISVEMVKRPPSQCPVEPELSLHWLAVDGVQPSIPENPSLVGDSVEDQPMALPREMQVSGIPLAWRLSLEP